MWAFFIALAASYLYSIRISFSFYCAASVLSLSYSFLYSVFLYAFIISLCPWISKSLFIWGKKSPFQPFYFLVLHHSQFPLLASFFCLVLLDSLHFTSWQIEVLPFSRIPGFLCFLQQLMLLLLLITNWMLFCLPPMECMWIFFQNYEYQNTYIGVGTSAKIL